MLKISDFSKLCQLSIKTIRYYDEIGLLKPEYVDEVTGYRYYTSNQMLDLQRIVMCRQVGISIAQIKKTECLATLLKARLKTVHEQIDVAQQQLSMIKAILNLKEEIMSYQATMKNIPGYTVFVRRGIIKDFAGINAFICEAGAECALHNPTLKCVTPDYCYVSYLDKKFKETNINLMYAQAVEVKGNESENIKFETLGPIRVVSILHKGSYDKLSEAYAFAMRFIEENHLNIIDLIRERYIDGIWNKDNVDEWVTEIEIPVEKL